MLVFDESGNPEYPENNLSEQSRDPTNSTHIGLTPSLGIEPEPHWWEASALNTSPALHLQSEDAKTHFRLPRLLPLIFQQYTGGITQFAHQGENLNCRITIQSNPIKVAIDSTFKDNTLL